MMCRQFDDLGHHYAPATTLSLLTAVRPDIPPRRRAPVIP
jgi:hypothetical protein